jgi:DNA-binding MarR family transcriptional regulator
MVAELVEQLGHCACSQGFSAGLNPAQWAALRYFERANRFSRTVSAFADYHGTTRGTASQTIRALVQKGFLRRLPAEHDQRSFRLELTGHARATLDADPLAGFVSAAASLPQAQCSVLAQGLRSMLERLQDKGARRFFGVCTSCRHLSKMGADGQQGCAHRCTFKNAILQDGELGKICIDFESRRNH